MFVSELGQDSANPSTELSNWDFLQDELFPEPDLFVPAVPQAAGTSLASSDNTREKNRIAQKRFRQRKKVHPHQVLSDHSNFVRMFPFDTGEGSNNRSTAGRNHLAASQSQTQTERTRSQKQLAGESCFTQQAAELTG